MSSIVALQVDNFLPIQTAYPVAPFETSLNDCSAVVLCQDAMLVVLALDYDKFLQLLQTRQLHQRMDALKQRSEWAYLYLIGSARSDSEGNTIINGHATKWNWNAIQGAVLSVQDMGVSVAYIADEAQFGEALRLLSERDRSAKRAKAVRHYEQLSPAEEMLLSLPHVGEKIMVELMHEYRSAAWALVELTAPESKIENIGDKAKAAIRAALGLAEGQRLYIGNVDQNWNK